MFCCISEKTLVPKIFLKISSFLSLSEFNNFLNSPCGIITNCLNCSHVIPSISSTNLVTSFGPDTVLSPIFISAEGLLSVNPSPLCLALKYCGDLFI